MDALTTVPGGAGPWAGALTGADLAGDPAGNRGGRIVCFAPAGSRRLAMVSEYAAGRSLAWSVASSPEEAARLVLGPPLAAAVVVEWPGGRSAAPSAGAPSQSEAEALCRWLKGNPLTATVPVVALARGGARSDAAEAIASALEAGADEVLAARLPRREQLLRLERTLRRSERDLAVHPATRLPGAPALDRRLSEEIAAGRALALCHADLDHFKEYNDRYGPAEGDRTILLLAAILRDVARDLAPDGFVGHVGGDDFALLTTPERVAPCCEEIVRVFGEAAALLYDRADQRAGGFAAQDRWGSARWIPLMAISIGVAAGEAGAFASPSELQALAAKMKGRAKRSPGSAWLAGFRPGGPRVRQGGPKRSPGSAWPAGSRPGGPGSHQGGSERSPGSAWPAGDHGSRGLSYFSESLLACRLPATTPGEESAERHGNRPGKSSSLRPSVPRRPRSAGRGASGVPLTSTGDASESKRSTPKWRAQASGTTGGAPGA